jgi:ComF family protein
MSIRKKFFKLFDTKCIYCKEKKILNQYGFCSPCFKYITVIENLPKVDKYHIFKYEGPIKDIIQDLKYRRKKFLAKQLANIIFTHIQKSSINEFDFIIPVPLHWRKEFKRGFNQSALISVYLGLKLKKKTLLGVLVKNKNTFSQTNLTFSERKLNIKNAFIVKKPPLIKGKQLLLLDDVYTSGATVNEAKKTLLSAGASEVIILTLARV